MNGRSATALIRLVSDYQGEAHYAVLQGPLAGTTVRVRPNRYEWDLPRFGVHWTPAYRREREATEGGIIAAGEMRPTPDVIAAVRRLYAEFREQLVVANLDARHLATLRPFVWTREAGFVVLAEAVAPA